MRPVTSRRLWVGRPSLVGDGRMDLRADAPERQAVLGAWALLVVAVICELPQVSARPYVQQPPRPGRQEKIGVCVVGAASALCLFESEGRGLEAETRRGWCRAPSQVRNPSVSMAHNGLGVAVSESREIVRGNT
jgi:hypothetical protein